VRSDLHQLKASEMFLGWQSLAAQTTCAGCARRRLRRFSAAVATSREGRRSSRIRPGYPPLPSFWRFVSGALLSPTAALAAAPAAGPAAVWADVASVSAFGPSRVLREPVVASAMGRNAVAEGKIPASLRVGAQEPRSHDWETFNFGGVEFVVDHTGDCERLPKSRHV